MKNSFLLIAGIIMSVQLHAQVLVTLQIPPSGVVMKSQLWNLSLVNVSNLDYSISIEMVITDATNNQRVLVGTSRMFILSKGAKQIKVADVVPVTYAPGAAGYNQNANPDGFLPVGVFNICYTVIRLQEGGTERLSEECEMIDIEPVSPPQLISPADSEQIEINRPLFTWLPPSPTGLFTNLLYDLLLVEVYPTQTAATAVQENLPLLRQQNLSTPSLQYPSSTRALDSNKLYAWRITAKSNTRAVTNSEVWAFRLKLPETAKASSQGYYIKASREEDASLAVCNGVLGYEYIQELNDNEISLALFDLTSPKRKQVALDSTECPVHFGQNFLKLDLRNLSAVTSHHIYLLELSNSRHEKRYIKFEYSNPDHQ